MSMSDLKDYLKQNTSNIKPTMESFIHPQLNDKFVDKLIELISSRYDIGDKYFKDELEELFSKRFNIKVNFILSNTYASFCLPMIGSALGDIPKDSFIFRILASELNVKYKDLRQEYENIKNADIKIDLKNAKIYGYDSKYNYIYIDKNMFKKDYFLNDREIAAIIMHEMGHIFTHIYYISHLFKNAFNLLESLQLYSNGEIARAKELIITSKDVKDKDYKIIFKKQLEDYKKLMDKYMGAILGMQGPDTLNKVSEIEADEFATKFGLGDALVTGLNKLMLGDYAHNLKAIWRAFSTIYIFLFLFYLIRIFLAGYSIVVTIIASTIAGLISTVDILLTVTLLVIIASAIIKLLEMLGIKFVMFRYDKLKHRIERIKRNAIKILRTYKLDKDALDKVIATIEAVEKGLEEIDKSFINTNIGSILIADIRNFGSIDNIDELFDIISDRLTNNDFHYLAEKVKR